MSDLSPVVVAGAALTGVIGGWAVTLPAHRYKEFRPLGRRDVDAEALTTVAPTRVRAVYRTARCGRCHHECGPADVAPFVCWFRGCPACGRRMPATVIGMQALIPVLCVVTALALGGSAVAIPYLWLIICGIGISVIDLRLWLIPWWMPWALAASGFAMIVAVSLSLGIPAGIIGSLLGGLAWFALFFVMWLVSPRRIGFSDVRLALALGLFVGWLAPVLTMYAVFISSVVALVIALASWIGGRGTRFAFGPAMVLGSLIAVWLHPALLPAR